LEPVPSHSAARKRAAARRFQALGTDAFIIVAGEQRDAETGLYNLRARYYDERTGRFLSTDPRGGGYGYAGNNPVRFIDPLGLYQICTWWDEGQVEVCFDSTQVGLGPCDVEGACYYWSEEGGVEWAIACSANICLFPDGSIRGPDYHLDHASNYVDTTRRRTGRAIGQTGNCDGNITFKEAQAYCKAYPASVAAERRGKISCKWVVQWWSARTALSSAIGGTQRRQSAAQ
jgi:RHS repeat-associated protein